MLSGISWIVWWIQYIQPANSGTDELSDPRILTNHTNENGEFTLEVQLPRTKVTHPESSQWVDKCRTGSGSDQMPTDIAPKYKKAAQHKYFIDTCL